MNLEGMSQLCAREREMPVGRGWKVQSETEKHCRCSRSRPLSKELVQKVLEGSPTHRHRFRCISSIFQPILTARELSPSTAKRK
eukprot:scaffold15160_cov119-Skeletonema_dohrnii-CCMP3373.AAC.1